MTPSVNTAAPTVADIIRAIEEAAPLALQEDWDNSGLQVGRPDTSVTGVLVCLDVSPLVVAEARNAGANLIVSHHPLIFRPLRAITGANATQLCVEEALRAGIAVYSAHTSLDNAPGGVSWQIADALAAVFPGLQVEGPLSPTAPGADSGCGLVCQLARPVPAQSFCSDVARALGCEAVRRSGLHDPAEHVTRFAVCGGAGGSFIPDAVRAGAQAYITGDIRHHDFVDAAYGPRPLILIDCGHFETERLALSRLAAIVADAFPGLPVRISTSEQNPIHYQYQ